MVTHPQKNPVMPNLSPTTLANISQFQTILSAKKVHDLKLMHEASLARIYQHYLSSVQDKDSSFALLTSWRNSLSKEENMKRFHKLQQQIRSMGYGFIRVDGYWQECQDDSIPYEDCPEDLIEPSKEKTLFIIGISKEQAVRLMREYQQDAVVYSGKETDDSVTLIMNNGSEASLGAFTPNTLGQAYTKYKGKSFHFEWVAQTHFEKLVEKLFL